MSSVKILANNNAEMWEGHSSFTLVIEHSDGCILSYTFAISLEKAQEFCSEFSKQGDCECGCYLAGDFYTVFFIMKTGSVSVQIDSTNPDSLKLSPNIALLLYEEMKGLVDDWTQNPKKYPVRRAVGKPNPTC